MSQQIKKGTVTSASQQTKKGAAVIFNAREVADHLESLKANAIEGSRWWAPAIKFDWHEIRRPQGSATSWVSIHYTAASKVTGRLVLRILNEGHTGQIMPCSDRELAALVSASKSNQKVQYKKRDKKPAIQIRKWDAAVKTLEDGVTLLTGEDGEPILPDAQYLSPYFRVASLVGEAFQAEAGERVDRGRALIAAIQAAAARKAKPGEPAELKPTAQAILAAFAEVHGPARPDLVFVAQADSTTVRKLLPPKEVEQILKGVTLVASTHIAPLVQEYLSDKNEKNPGAPLPNPITRIALNFDADSGAPQRLTFFDKSKPFAGPGGRKAFEAGKVDGIPVNAENVHKFVLPQCHVDGIVNADSICFSNMGISIPVKMEVAVIDPPSKRAVGLFDVYGDEEGGEGGEGGEGSGDGEATPDGEPGSPAPAEPTVDETGDLSLDSLMSQISSS